MNRINVTRSSMPSLDEYVNEIKDIWESRWLTNMGQKHQKLEEELQKRLGIENVMLYTNGHLALEAIWELLDFPKGSEVITTPFTFCSTVNAIYRSGLTPVFCDVDPVTYCMDPAKIESLITSKTVAICPVHVYGNFCDVEEIEKISKKHNLKVIYDAAHAFGVKYKGVSSANFGDLVMYSFHATKVFNTIEGGAICFKDGALKDALNEYRDFGIKDAESVPLIGGNAKMNEFQAAMGICNLRHLDSEIEKRKRVVERYRMRLGGKKGIRLPFIQNNVESNYAYFPVIFDNYKLSRDEVCKLLLEKGIVARKYFYPIVNELECYKQLKDITIQKTPIAKWLGDRVVTLPLYADLSLDEVDYICNIIIGEE